MAARISICSWVCWLACLCAAFSSPAAGQVTPSTRRSAPKSAPAAPKKRVAGQGPADLVQKHLSAAQAAEQQGDLIRAESEDRQALGLALEQLGEAYQALGDLENAEAAYRGATEASVDSDRSLLGLGAVYLQKGQFQKGVDAVRTLLAQKPAHAQARQLLGKLYFSMNRFEAAALELQEAQRLSPEDTEAAVPLAFTYLRQKQLDKAQKIFTSLLQKHGESPQIHIMFGAAYRETEYVNQAVEEFKRAVTLDAGYPGLHYYLALAYLSQERSQSIPQALAELAEEARRHPNEYSAHYWTGVIYVQEHKLEEAIPVLEKAARLDPDNPDTPLYLGQATYLLGRTDQAVPLLQKAIELTKDPSRNQYQVSKAHYLLGQYFSRRGEMEEAKQHLGLAESYKAKASVQQEERLRTYMGSGMGAGDELKNEVGNMESRGVIIAPEPPKPGERQRLEKAATFYSEAAGTAYNQLGLLRAREADFKRAAGLLAQAAHWTPELPDLQFNLGLAQFKIQNYAGAISPLEKALARQPDRADIRMLLGMSCFFHEDYRRALEALGPLGEAGAADPQVAYALGLSLVHSGNRERGVEILRTLVEKYPGAADTHMALGQAYAVREEYGNAASEFSKALDLDPSVPEGHYNLGVALLRREQFAEAATEFRREVEHNPQHAKAQYHLGLALASLNQTDDAARQFSTATRLDPSYGDAYYELGKAQVKQGKVDDGVTSLEKAAQLEADKSYVQYQLSQAYLKLGRTEAAQAALARYQDLKAHERGAAPTPSEPRH